MATPAQVRAVASYIKRKRADGYKHLVVLLSGDMLNKLDTVTAHHDISRTEFVRSMIQEKFSALTRPNTSV